MLFRSVYEIAAGERTVKEKFGAAPMLTAFLKSDVTAGTLIVVANEEDAKVFVNGDEYKRKLQKGQLRIQTLGQVRVSVAKDGYQAVEPQTVQVKKGQEVRIEFALKEIPKAQPKPVEVAKAAPAPAAQPAPEVPKPVVVEPKQEPVLKEAPKPVAPRTNGIADFADAWKADDGGWSRKGGGFVKFNPTPDGTFTFSVKLVKGGNIFRGGRVRWFLNYVDDKNYSLYETDGKTFWANVIMKGVKYERTKVPVNISDKAKAYRSEEHTSELQSH